MEYGVRYRVEYKDSAGVMKKIDIEELDYAGSVIDCEAGDDPLVIEIPAADPITHIPVIASGCTINMISTSSMMFLGLYSINPQKLRVRIYAGTSSVPYFVGYGTPEVHNESYARLQDYDVFLYCNDGFAVLERFKYLDAGGAKYTTLETLWTILTRILTKMGLPFEYLYFACRLQEYGVTVGGTETIFHQLLIDQENYYNEKDEPMTFREVLEAILTTFGLQIRWRAGSLIICEPQMLAETNFSAKRFNPAYAYVDTVTLTLNFDISNEDINWDNEDQRLDTKSGYSRQVIRYSPYIREGAVKEVDVSNRFIWTGTETWTADGYGILRLSGITAIAGISYGAGVSLTGRKRSADDEEDIYLERNAWNIGYVILDISGYKIGLVEGQALRVTGEVFIKTKDDEFNDSVASVTANRIEIPVNLEIDGKGLAWNGTYWDWNVTYDPVAYKAKVYKATGDVTVCDRWMNFSIELPGYIANGPAILKVGDPEVYAASIGGSPLMGGDGMKHARLRNLKVRAFEGAKEISNDDVEYKGVLDIAFLNEAPGITLAHGDARNITDRAGIRRANKSFTTDNWKKTVDTLWSYRLSDLLLRSIISQYKDSLQQLSGTIEADALMLANGGPGFLFTIQDMDNLSTRKLLFTGGTYNDFYRTLNGTFLEIKQDDLTINIIS
jgi:hypothetical protein